MTIDGKHYMNVTCKCCGFRHPSQFTCEQARKAAEANHTMQLAEAQPRAYEACDVFDAAVFSGDEFIDEGGLALLDEHLQRWRRTWLERRPDIQQYTIDTNLRHRRLVTLVRLLETHAVALETASHRLKPLGLTAKESREWARQIENITVASEAASPIEKDPLLL